MTKNDLHAETPAENKKVRRKYQPPALIHYGALSDLTQTGSGPSNEANAGAGGGSCNDDPKKRPCQAASDRKVKQNIKRIGSHRRGFGLYLFDYKPEYAKQWGEGRQFGVIAQEVEKVVPEAVSMHPGGYRLVDYSVLGIRPSAG
jgi:hypothetical protein